MIEIAQMMTNLQIRPIAVGKGPVRFSWRYESDENSVRQDDYRITVFRSKDRQAVWDSGIFYSREVEALWNGNGLCSDTEYTWTLDCTVHSENGSVKLTQEAAFETALLELTDWHGQWIGETAEKKHHIFRRAFDLQYKPVLAKLYVCGLGHHECWLNGQPVTDSVPARMMNVCTRSV